jgi:hypothetical protein
LFKA